MAEKKAVLTAAQREEIVQTVANILGSGGSIGMSRGFSGEEIEVSYSVAASFYEQKQYDKALDAFKFLCFNEHMDSRMWMGFGACCQMLGDYKRAIQAYSCVSILDIDNIKAPFYAAECYIALQDWEMAAKAMEAVKHWLDEGWKPGSKLNQSEFASFRDKASILEKSIETQRSGAH